MREGKGSRTAQFAAYNRALGNLSPAVAGFSDPVAEVFLPGNLAKRVERGRRKLLHSPSSSPYPFWMRGMGTVNQYRTLVLDCAIRSAVPFEQMVILGAGFDSRAWRLPFLKQTIVFEVDHADTQALKRSKASWMPSTARDTRFVPVDFSRDSLSDRLLNSGFDRNGTTMWLWEAVTMYLDCREVSRTLSVAAELSPPDSRLAMTYMKKRRGKVPQSMFLSMLGEPVRSAYEPGEIAGLLRADGWIVDEDSCIEDWETRIQSGINLSRRNVGLQWNERILVGTRDSDKETGLIDESRRNNSKPVESTSWINTFHRTHTNKEK